jgi:hypothetical protein
MENARGSRLVTGLTDSERRELAAAEREGVIGQRRYVAHSFRFPHNQAGAREACAELLQRGWTNPSYDEEFEGDDLWHVWMFHPQLISGEALAQARDELQSVATRHGGRYVGWWLTRDGPDMTLTPANACAECREPIRQQGSWVPARADDLVPYCASCYRTRSPS